MITAVIPDHTSTIYVHGAEIADPHNDPNVTWDYSATPEQPVFVIDAEHGDALAALDAYGLSRTGIHRSGAWVLRQSRPLASGPRVGAWDNATVEALDDSRTGEYNKDTNLLSTELAKAYGEALLDRINGAGMLDQRAFDAAWYRVAERAKELRA